MTFIDHQLARCIKIKYYSSINKIVKNIHKLMNSEKFQDISSAAKEELSILAECDGDERGAEVSLC